MLAGVLHREKGTFIVLKLHTLDVRVTPILAPMEKAVEPTWRVEGLLSCIFTHAM